MSAYWYSQKPKKAALIHIFFCSFSQTCLTIGPLRLPVTLRSPKAFPDCCSALIKPWCYNWCLIRQNHHSSPSKATRVRRIWPHLHVQWSPTEKVKGGRISWAYFLIKFTTLRLRTYFGVQLGSPPAHVYWDKSCGLVKQRRQAGTVARLSCACDRWRAVFSDDVCASRVSWEVCLGRYVK